jgi:hypothetical protein
MTNTTFNARREEILTFLNTISTSSRELVELRAFGPQDTKFSGIFSDPAAMSTNAAALNAKGLVTATYFTLNPVAPEAVLNPAALNKVNRRPLRTTRDNNVHRRRLYLIDVDPVRPSGVSATDGEKAEALAVINQIHEYLTKLGWTDPVVIDSGNGYHLLYQGDGCGATSKPWVYVLKYLERTFSTDSAKVDTSVGNAAQISRLPGTWNRKGEDSAERPHRMAHVVSYPAKFEPLIHGHIYCLAANTGYEFPCDRAERYGGDKPELLIDETGVRQLIQEFPEMLHLGYDVRRDDGVYFFLSECPFKGGAHRDQMGKTAIILRDDHVGFKCFSADCQDHTFGGLLKLLHKTTGRRPSMPIWNTSREIEDWRYIVFGMEPPGTTDLYDEYLAEQEKRLKATPEWQYDNDTYNAVKSDSFLECPLSTDPAEWGLDEGLVFHHFVQNALEELDGLEGEGKAARNRELQTIKNIGRYPAMGEYLGKELLFALSRLQDRPVCDGEDWRFWKNQGLTEKEFDFILEVEPLSSTV